MNERLFQKVNAPASPGKATYPFVRKTLRSLRSSLPATKLLGRRRSSESEPSTPLNSDRIIRQSMIWRLLSLRTRRVEIARDDPYGETWLRVTCDEGTADADTVRRALAARFGHRPLHRACHPAEDAGPEIVALLLEANPFAATAPDATWRVPLHHAAMSERPDAVGIVQCLVDVAPTTPFYRDVGNATPVDAVWDEYNDPHRYDELVMILRKVGLASVPECGEEGHHHAVAWMKMNVMIKAAYYRQSSSVGSGSMPILHAAIGIGGSCPPAFLRLVMTLCAEQAARKDLEGRTPLHIAVGSPIATENNGGLASRPHRAMLGSRVDEVLSLYPGAARLGDAEGRLPLNIAILHGHTYKHCIEPVLHAAPEALQVPDPETHLYPFMLAASSVSSSNLDNAFELLRADPSLLQRAR